MSYFKYLDNFFLNLAHDPSQLVNIFVDHAYNIELFNHKAYTFQ